MKAAFAISTYSDQIGLIVTSPNRGGVTLDMDNPIRRLDRWLKVGAPISPRRLCRVAPFSFRPLQERNADVDIGRTRPLGGSLRPSIQAACTIFQHLS